MTRAVFILANALTLVLTACATEGPPKKQWTVKTKTLGEPKVWVWKPDGSRQCGAAPKLNPDVATEEFRGSGIMVYQSRMGTDGKMYPSMCGAGTGDMVELEIGRTDIVKALSMGYQTKIADSPAGN